MTTQATHQHAPLDDAGLLKAILADAERAPDLYTATPYWQAYTRRIAIELKNVGLRDFRTNQIVLKGFGSGGYPTPGMPQATWKRCIWQAAAAAPIVRSILTEHQRILRTLSKRLRQAEIQLARHQINTVAQAFPKLRIPDGIANGGADDAFEWNGSQVTADWVMYLSRAADFYSSVAPETVSSLLEIGPGIGLSTLAHIALNPHLRVVVNIDISPVTYVSTRFLATSNSINVVDYNSVRDLVEIPLNVPAPLERPTVWSLPAWCLPRVMGRLDYGFNAFSFQEMEHDVCENYAREVMRLVRHGIQLHSRTDGHATGAGGQTAAITMSFLKRLFAEAFPHSEVNGHIWAKGYDRKADEAVLLTKN